MQGRRSASGHLAPIAEEPFSFRGVANGLYGNLKHLVTKAKLRSNLADTYHFTDRSKHRKTVVILLAGYKPDLWPYVLPRLCSAIPGDCDVCVMTAGRTVDYFASLCSERGWSHLATKTNDVGLVQNIAIKLHPDAELIVKVDEDMFVTSRTIRDTVEYYRSLKDSRIVNPGFVAPMININGVCYRPLLKQLGLLEEFEDRFGVAGVSTLGIPATDDGRVARWLWEKTTPLEETAAKLARSSVPRLMAPVQFSIGLIAFERSFWEEIGYFQVHRHRLLMRKQTLGADEQYICQMAVHLGRPMVVCEHALAGHFSFGRQYQEMLGLLRDRPDIFEAPKPIEREAATHHLRPKINGRSSSTRLSRPLGGE